MNLGGKNYLNWNINYHGIETTLLFQIHGKPICMNLGGKSYLNWNINYHGIETTLLFQVHGKPICMNLEEKTIQTEIWIGRLSGKQKLFKLKYKLSWNWNNIVLFQVHGRPSCISVECTKTISTEIQIGGLSWNWNNTHNMI